MIAKRSFRDLLLYILGIIAALAICGFLFFLVWVLIKYGNTPVSELPSWVAWLIFK